MTYLDVVQKAVKLMPIRGRGRLAEMTLAGRNTEVVCHPLPGLTVYLRTNQRIERWMWAGAYERELVSLLERILKPGMTMLDLGANIGYFSAIAANLVGSHGRVHAFEPMPENFFRLEKNLKPFPWAESLRTAVGKTTGTATIHYNTEESGWASIHEEHPRGQMPSELTVSVVKLDDWLNTNPLQCLDFIKIDVEGSELDALLGAEEMLSRFHPTVVAETKLGWHREEINDLLAARGYVCRPFGADSILASYARI